MKMLDVIRTLLVLHSDSQQYKNSQICKTMFRFLLVVILLFGHEHTLRLQALLNIVQVLICYMRFLGRQTNKNYVITSYQLLGLPSSVLIIYYPMIISLTLFGRCYIQFYQVGHWGLEKLFDFNGNMIAQWQIWD